MCEPFIVLLRTSYKALFVKKDSSRIFAFRFMQSRLFFFYYFSRKILIKKYAKIQVSVRI